MSNYLLKQTIRKLKAPIRTLQPRKPKKKKIAVAKGRNNVASTTTVRRDTGKSGWISTL